MSGSLSRIWLFAGSLTCARTDGCCVSSGGRDTFDFDSMLVAPWLAHSGVHRPRCSLAGALPPEFIFGSRRFFFLWLFLSSPSACVSCEAWPFCFDLFSRLCCLRVVCIHYELCVFIMIWGYSCMTPPLAHCRSSLRCSCANRRWPLIHPRRHIQALCRSCANRRWPLIHTRRHIHALCRSCANRRWPLIHPRRHIHALAALSTTY